MKTTLCHCDRCKEAMHPTEQKTFVLKTTHNLYVVNRITNLEMDLCSQCVNELKEFLNTPPVG